MKKAILAIVLSAIAIPTVALCWGRIQAIWAAPLKLKSVEEVVIQQAETQEAVKDLVVEQKVANEKQDAQIQAQREITAAQIEALKELVVQLRKR